jgi:hypothetical protein
MHDDVGCYLVIPGATDHVSGAPEINPLWPAEMMHLDLIRPAERVYRPLAIQMCRNSY